MVPGINHSLTEDVFAQFQVWFEKPVVVNSSCCWWSICIACEDGFWDLVDKPLCKMRWDKDFLFSCTVRQPPLPLCWLYAGSMQALSGSKAGSMLALCWLYAALCWLYAGSILSMLALCWLYAGSMLALCSIYPVWFYPVCCHFIGASTGQIFKLLWFRSQIAPCNTKSRSHQKFAMSQMLASIRFKRSKFRPYDNPGFSKWDGHLYNNSINLDFQIR